MLRTRRPLGAVIAAAFLVGAMLLGLPGIASAQQTCQPGQGQYPPGRNTAGGDCADVRGDQTGVGLNPGYQNSNRLPRTGSVDLIPLILLGIALIAAGGAVVVAARRRREDAASTLS